MSEYRPIVWLDEHTGPVFQYAATLRPTHPGFTIPRDGYLCRLETSEAAKHPDYPHGLVYYSRELTKLETNTFSLVRLNHARQPANPPPRPAPAKS